MSPRDLVGVAALAMLLVQFQACLLPGTTPAASSLRATTLQPRDPGVRWLQRQHSLPARSALAWAVP